MTSLYLLIPLSLLLLALAVWAFFWAVSNDQFDDLDSPAHRILFDDDLAAPPSRRRAKAPAERDEPRR
ncbi:cbb3-type cytochrome oxidase assembly protein CcoS [Halomonas sp. PAMB 3264]|uniref:cbb3-type cytochrome oxidase assembly protein CcoS n=1 Tax=Halomonas sp. PAMB 3264 TaxID=3075222 RepID=UPI00289E3973|nr:cbb3-type cytochrome oxidase assembly protein CcoS [Halomonas sp. PAMB 3264]WNL41665.1 cbb3-type cytochrome oxidase assembly protein CcoS [Halomonas sp. PAMB 3264]